MAIVQNPIIGAAKKSAGGMVFSRSLDQNIIRAKPITYNDRNSEAQQVVRGRMKQVSGLTKADSKKALDALYPTRPFKQTKYSRFVQQIMKAFKYVAGVITTAWENVPTLGNGTLAMELRNPQLSAEPTQIIVSVDALSVTVGNALRYKMFYVLLNITHGTGTSGIVPASPSSSEAQIDYPNGWKSSDDIQGYVGIMDTASFNSTLAIQAFIP